MQHVACADPARLLGDLGGKPAARAQAAQHLLGADRPPEARDHVAGGDAELLPPAHARPNGFDCHAESLELLGDIRRRSRPRLQVARITKHAGDGHALEAQGASVSVEGSVHVRP
jgi:hypothetical protein